MISVLKESILEGWRLFIYSFRLVFENLVVALRISALIFAIQTAAALFLMHAQKDFAPVEGDLIRQPMVPYLIYLACIVFGGSWIAITWHRYVLSNEVPIRFIPRWPGLKILGYPLRVFLIVFTLYWILGFVLMAYGALGESTGLLEPCGARVTGVQTPIKIFLFFAIVACALLFLRLSPLLPAYALDKNLSVREAWLKTSEATLPILTLGIVSVAICYVLLWVPAFLFYGNPPMTFSFIYLLAMEWFQTLIGVSLLTTIYGHYVEGRNLS